MKCRSRSTLGYIIGGLCIFESVLIILFSIKDLARNNSRHNNNGTYIPDDYYLPKSQRHPENETEYGIAKPCVLIVVCVVMGILSGVLILGIMRRRASFIAPWIIFDIIYLFFSGIYAIYELYEIIAAGVNFSQFFQGLVLCVLVFGLNGFFLYKIYTLYKDIKTENNGRHSRFVSARDVGFAGALSDQPNDYAPVQQKF